MLQTTFLASPDAFVCPRIWIAHSTALTEVLLESPQHQPPAHHADNRTGAIRSAMRIEFEGVRRRNEALVFGGPAIRPPSTRRRKMEDIKVSSFHDIHNSCADCLPTLQTLDEITFKSDMNMVYASLFSPVAATDAVEFINAKLDTLLTWGVAHTSCGADEHRPYAVGTLLGRFERDRGMSSTRALASRGGKGKSRATSEDQVIDLQHCLSEWLEQRTVAKQAEHSESLAKVFGELIRLQLFSYGKYLQRLIAHGDTRISSQSVRVCSLGSQ